MALSYYDGHTNIRNYSFRAPVCISYSIDFQPSTLQGCNRNPQNTSDHRMTSFFKFPRDRWLLSPIHHCNLRCTQSQTQTQTSHDVFPVSTNQNFGPPHTSLKSTEPLWSLNSESCGFESMGIVIISRSLVLGPGSLVRYNTIQW